MTEKMVLVLHTTHQTMNVEKILKKNKIKHNIVSKPVKISKGCGIAISFYPEDREDIKILCKADGMEYEGIFSEEGDKLE